MRTSPYFQSFPVIRQNSRHPHNPNNRLLFVYIQRDVYLSISYPEDYGFEADIEIFRPLFSKERFPKLTYLGIVNSEEQDKIVEMFLESDILPQLETMDVSAGTLKDEGAQLLLDNMDKIAHLKFINMRYNYLSKEMKKQLQSLPMKIDIAETEEADEYDGELWYYPMITE